MFSVAVMAHPTRTDAAHALAQQLGAMIVWDRVGDEWDTGARALAAFDPDASHHIVVQDDAVPVPEFLTEAAAAIAHRPASPISFYLGTGRPPKRQPAVQLATEKADAQAAAWISCNRMLHGVAIALPVTDIGPLLAWAKRSTQPYDQRIGTWYRFKAHREILYTWPSLVDHADDGSIAVHPDGETRDVARVARRVGIPDSWDTDTVSI